MMYADDRTTMNGKMNLFKQRFQANLRRDGLPVVQIMRPKIIKITPKGSREFALETHIKAIATHAESIIRSKCLLEVLSS